MRSRVDALPLDDVLRRRRWTADERARFVATGLAARAAVTLDEIRVSNGLSVRELAARTGTSKTQVLRLLSGSYGGLTLRSLVRIAQALGCEVRVEVVS